MLRQRLLPALAAAALLGSACSSGGANSLGSPRPSRSRDRITVGEIQASAVTNVFEAIQRLRNTWLQPPRGGAECVAPVVFVDNVKRGGTESLRLINIEDIEEIRYVNPRDATTRWGSAVPGAVIEVILRR